MIFDLLDLISLGPIPYFVLFIVFLIIGWYTLNAWIQGGSQGFIYLFTSITSFVLAIIFFLVALWHSLEYLDLPFKGRKARKDGLVRCRVCYQYKQIAKGDVCNDCWPTVEDHV